MNTYRVQTTVRGLQVGDVLTNGKTVVALGIVTKDRHVSRYIRAVQFQGENFSRSFNAATTITVLRQQLIPAPAEYRSPDRWTPGTWQGD